MVVIQWLDTHTSRESLSSLFYDAFTHLRQPANGSDYAMRELCEGEVSEGGSHTTITTTAATHGSDGGKSRLMGRRMREWGRRDGRIRGRR